MIDQILLMLPVYLPLCAFVALGVGVKRWGPAPWRRRGEAVLVVALPLLIGFCVLEQRWPWEMHGPWRAHYWIPLGLILLGLMGCGGEKMGTWKSVVLPLLGATALYGLLTRYAGQLREEWSPAQEIGLLAALLLLGSGHALGHAGWARRFPAWGYFLVLGGLAASGSLYAFFSAASLKVAQWMTLAGTVAACGLGMSVIVGRSERVASAAAWVAGWFSAAVLLYGFYAAESAALLPLALLLGSAVPGLPFLWEGFAARRGWRWTAGLVATGVVLAMVASYLVVKAAAEEGEGDSEESDLYDLDAYGWVDETGHRKKLAVNLHVVCTFWEPILAFEKECSLPKANVGGGGHRGLLALDAG